MDKEMKQFARELMGAPNVVISARMVKRTGEYVRAEIEPRAGWLVGYRALMTKWGVGGDYMEGRYSHPVQYESVYQVTLSPTHRPVLVPKDAIKLNTEGKKASAMSEEARRQLSKDMKAWFVNPGWKLERDASGRFV